MAERDSRAAAGRAARQLMQAIRVHPGESILSGGGRLGRLSVAPRAT